MVRRTAAALVLLAMSTALPAVAHARALVGMGDQKPEMFTDARFRWLGVREARIVVSWNVMRSPSERAWADTWLRDARKAGVQPLVAFGHEWSGKQRTALPSVKAYRAAFLRFQAAYPWVKTYTGWNEANHCSQPTCHHPERAAAYYDVIRDACPRCTVVAGDVLDQNNMIPWLRRFQKAVRHKPTLWGLHNYLDANRMRSTGTRKLLKAVKGRVWITETGGLVRRKHYRAQIAFPESAAHAGDVTRFILQFADTHARIRRVYIYQWNANSLFQTWDSGLIDPFGQRRPAFVELAHHFGRNPARAPKDPPFVVDTAPPPPGPAGPGAEEKPAQQQPPPAPQPAPPPQSPPPPPPQNCAPLPICPPVIGGGG
jgi:hypothetical protein